MNSWFKAFGKSIVSLDLSKQSLRIAVTGITQC